MAAPGSRTDARIESAPVLESRAAGSECWFLRFSAPAIAPRLGPGQFVHVKPESRLVPYLRRPFSIYDVPETPSGAVDLLFTVIGSGTAALAALRPGDRLSVLGPLGRTFTLPADGTVTVLVAGGIGVAPFPDLARRVIAGGADPTRDVIAVLGARTRDLLYCRDDFARLRVPVHVATDDGSEGFRGNAVQCAARVLDGLGERPARVYGCGPEPMLRALQALCVERKIPGELSIDRRMACGVGICRSCVVRVADGSATGWHNEATCREGPVFDTATLRW